MRRRRVMAVPGGVRAALAADLRDRYEHRPVPWDSFAVRQVERLENDPGPVVVPAWQVRRFLPGLRSSDPAEPLFVRLDHDGSATPVVPVRHGVDIVAWREV